MKRLLRGLSYLALFGFISTIVIEATLSRRATLVQMVRRKDAVWETVGQPLEVLDVPTQAIVQRGPAGGATLVDVGKLSSQPVLEMRTVRGTAALARIGTLIAALALFLGSNALDRLSSTLTDD